MQLERKAYEEFLRQWKEGLYRNGGLRLGQAFYNSFKLYQLKDQGSLLGLYEKEGQNALDIINQIFQFN